MEGIPMPRRHESDEDSSAPDIPEAHDHSPIVDNIIDGIDELRRAAEPEPDPYDIEKPDERTGE